MVRTLPEDPPEHASRVVGGMHRGQQGLAEGLAEHGTEAAVRQDATLREQVHEAGGADRFRDGGPKTVGLGGVAVESVGQRA